MAEANVTAHMLQTKSLHSSSSVKSEAYTWTKETARSNRPPRGLLPADETSPHPKGPLHLSYFHCRFLAAAAVIAWVCLASPLGAQNGWRMDAYNPQRTNSSPAIGPASSPTFQPIITNASAKLIRTADNGDLILIQSIFSQGFGKVQRYSNSGALLWEALVPEDGYGLQDVAIGDSGTVYVADPQDVTAIDPVTGHIRWSQSNGTAAGEMSPLAVSHQSSPIGEIVFLHSGGGPASIFALRSDGTEPWAPIALGNDRGYYPLELDTTESRIYLATFLYPTLTLNSYYTATGTWASKAPNSCYFSGLQRVTPWNAVLAFDPSDEIEELSSDLSACTMPLIQGYRGNVQTITTGQQIVTDDASTDWLYTAFSSQGTQLWKSSERLGMGLSDGNNIIYAVAPLTNEVVAIAADTGVYLWRYQFPGFITNLLLGGDGALYVQIGTNIYSSGSTAQLGTITVATNLQSSGFTITDGHGHTYQGSGTSFTTQAPPGTYTITYGLVSCFSAPVPQTISLAAAGTIAFDGQYQGAASVSVNVIPAGASSATFSISPSVSGMRNTGPYPVMMNGVWPQQYTVTYNGVIGYNAPAAQSLSTAGSCALDFLGQYSKTQTYSTASLSVRTTVPAGFSVYQSGSLLFSGYQSAQFQLPAPGTYTVKYAAQQGYYTPQQQTLTLAPHDSTVLSGVYRRLILLSFTGFGSAPTPPTPPFCLPWILGDPLAGVGSGIMYPQVTWNTPGNGMTTLLYEIKQNPALAPGAHLAGFTFYSTDGNGHQLGHACSAGSDATHFEAEQWYESQKPTDDDIVAVVGHSYGGNRARLFATTLQYGRVPDFLATVDPIDWDICNLADAVLDLIDWQFTIPQCDQRLMQYIGNASNVLSFHQVKGQPLGSPKPILGLSGYRIYGLPSTLEPDYHDAIDDDPAVHTAITNSLLSLIGGPHPAAVLGVPTRSGQTIFIPLSISVTGSGTATAVTLTSASLNGVPVANLSAISAFGDIAAGTSSGTVLLQFPGSAAKSGSTANLSIAGTYSYGQTFTNTFPRLAIP